MQDIVKNIPDYVMYEVIESLGDYLEEAFIGNRLVTGKRVAIILEYRDRDLTIEVKNLKSEAN